MQERLLRPFEVARLCGVTTATVRTWIREGYLRSIRLSSKDVARPRCCVSRAALQDFLESRLEQA